MSELPPVIIVVLGIGAPVSVALVFYVTACLIYSLLHVELNARTELRPYQMPVLRPLPIPTKHQDNVLKRLLAFVFEVRHWQLVEPWTYQYAPNLTLVIPRGFVFDGASIPRPLWAVLSPTGLLLIPGLVHDYGYKHDHIWKLTHDQRITPYWVGAGRAHWDRLFTDISRDVTGLRLLSVIARSAVVLGGRSAWRNHRRVNSKPSTPSRERVLLALGLNPDTSHT
ncbi:MAG: DUF1353 domain-containing protein [Pseudomonadota bacterium]